MGPEQGSDVGSMGDDEGQAGATEAPMTGAAEAVDGFISPKLSSTRSQIRWLTA